MLSYVMDMWSLALQGDLKGIWFWAAVYAVLACGYSVGYQLRVRRWAQTTGMLDHARVSTFGPAGSDPSSTSYHADAQYTYTVQGTAYSGNRVSPWIVLTNKNLRAIQRRQLSAIEVGSEDSVAVYYNPKKPSKAFLVLPGVWGIGATILMGLALGVGFASKYGM